MKKISKKISSFVAIVCTVVLLVTSVSAAGAFSDLDGYWAKNIIEKWASIEGLLDVSTGGQFRPKDPVTVDEFNLYMDIFFAKDASELLGASSKVYRDMAFKVFGTFFDCYSDDLSVLDGFEDREDIEDEYAGYIAGLIKAGIIEGYGNGSIGCTDTLKRGELLVLIDKFVNFDEYVAALDAGGADGVEAPDTGGEDGVEAPDTGGEDGVEVPDTGTEVASTGYGIANPTSKVLYRYDFENNVDGFTAEAIKNSAKQTKDEALEQTFIDKEGVMQINMSSGGGWAEGTLIFPESDIQYFKDAKKVIWKVMIKSSDFDKNNWGQMVPTITTDTADYKMYAANEAIVTREEFNSEYSIVTLEADLRGNSVKMSETTVFKIVVILNGIYSDGPIYITGFDFMK